ncbi:MAG: hypothetical protein V3U67_04965 [Gemmatimonadota bacterium]
MEKDLKAEENRPGNWEEGSTQGGSWLDRIERPAMGDEPAGDDSRGATEVTPFPPDTASAQPPAEHDGDRISAGHEGQRSGLDEFADTEILGEGASLSIRGLREAAIEMARRDARSDLPAVDAVGRCESEEELVDRSCALFENWQTAERSRLNSTVARTEEVITDSIGRTGLEIDRFERITSELFRLKKRWDARRDMVSADLTDEELPNQKGKRGFKTHWYAAALSFLWLVELLANSPIFGALLPRDPLTEQQLRFVSETSSGWLAGAQRVISQFILRPDAFMLAAGVVTFLLVLAHFFGHSLRGLLMQKSASTGGDRVSHRSSLEYVIPMALSGVGLALVLGVLFEARLTLGEVAVDRFAHDSTAIEELRRQAAWLRVDGNLVAANQEANRADDMEALAKEQREYAASMSSLSFPILLLNSTLVLVAISSAYFHMRDPRRDRFNEIPFERDRRDLIDAGELAAQKASETLSRLVRNIRDLQGLMTEKPLKQWQGLVHQLEGMIVAYRAENGRLRGIDPRAIPAFADPVELDLTLGEDEERDLLMRDPEEYETERRALTDRFETIRARFTEEATAW